jgi:hypothetical protein
MSDNVYSDASAPNVANLVVEVPDATEQAHAVVDDDRAVGGVAAGAGPNADRALGARGVAPDASGFGTARHAHPHVMEPHELASPDVRPPPGVTARPRVWWRVTDPVRVNRRERCDACGVLLIAAGVGPNTDLDVAVVWRTEGDETIRCSRPDCTGPLEGVTLLRPLLPGIAESVLDVERPGASPEPRCPTPGSPAGGVPDPYGAAVELWAAVLQFAIDSMVILENELVAFLRARERVLEVGAVVEYAHPDWGIARGRVLGRHDDGRVLVQDLASTGAREWWPVKALRVVV